MPMIGTFFAASSIGLPSALNWVGAITTAAGFSATAFSRIVISPLMSDFGLGAEFRHVDVEVLGGLAGAGEHDLPVGRGRVLDDDRDRRFVGGEAGAGERRDRNNGAGAKQLFQHLGILPGSDALRAMALGFGAGLGAGCDSRQNANMPVNGWQRGATNGRAPAQRPNSPVDFRPCSAYWRAMRIRPQILPSTLRLTRPAH